MRKVSDTRGPLRVARVALVVAPAHIGFGGERARRQARGGIRGGSALGTKLPFERLGMRSSPFPLTGRQAAGDRD